MKICHLCGKEFEPIIEEEDVCNDCIVETCQGLLSKIPHLNVIEIKKRDLKN